MAVPADCDSSLTHDGLAPLHTIRQKRVLDVIGAVLGLIVFAPVLLLTALAVYVTDGGPILFRQVRVGAGGRHFNIVKFRSMRVDAEAHLATDPELSDRYLANNHKLEAHEDCRLTPIGRFIRATSLDEFPQFWNVLRGDMSLVGPRPVLPAELQERYGALQEHYKSARPGITGAWQVSGRSHVEYDRRVLLDTTYIEDWSLRRDFLILLRTPGQVVRQDGAY